MNVGQDEKKKRNITNKNHTQRKKKQNKKVNVHDLKKN